MQDREFAKFRALFEGVRLRFWRAKTSPDELAQAFDDLRPASLAEIHRAVQAAVDQLFRTGRGAPPTSLSLQHAICTERDLTPDVHHLHALVRLTGAPVGDGFAVELLKGDDLGLLACTLDGSLNVCMRFSIHRFVLVDKFQKAGIGRVTGAGRLVPPAVAGVGLRQTLLLDEPIVELNLPATLTA